MKLTVVERLMLLTLLPKEGSIITLKLIRNIRDQLGFDDEEITKLNFQNPDDGKMVWDAEAAKECEKEVAFGVNDANLVKETLENLSAEERLPMDAMSLWEKFVDAKLRVVDDGQEEE